MAAQIDSKMIYHFPFKVLGRLIAWALLEGRPLTTKGQWINALVFALYKLSQLLPQKNRSDNPIYIVGTGRSGTTVLGTLLGMHKQLMFLNEPKAAWHFAHGQEDLIGSYSNQTASIRLKSGRLDDNEVCKRLTRIYSLALRLGLSERIVDKYPELVFRISYVESLFPNAQFIVILRDGVDTCSSVTHWSKNKSETKGEEIHDWWGRNDRKWKLLVDQVIPEHSDLLPLQNKLYNVKDHRDRAAVEWIVSMREACKIQREHKSVLAIKYEELCNNTSFELNRVLEHCHLDKDPKFSAYANSVLDKIGAYKPLELMPELVESFCEVLKMTGYEKSCTRVKSRTVLQK